MNTYELTEKFIKDLILNTFGIETVLNITTDPRGISCEISTVEPADRGLLIGYKGENVDSIRRLARVWGKRNNIALHVFVRFNYQ
jgi:predicted RNA-binding protein Jag